jgi:hypothetical protein
MAVLGPGEWTQSGLSVEVGLRTVTVYGYGQSHSENKMALLLLKNPVLCIASYDFVC